MAPWRRPAATMPPPEPGMTEALRAALGHAPTAGQDRAIAALDRLMATAKERATLVLKGYAGTGKTTLVGALVRVLRAQGRPVVLLAPTGRAAKVLGAYANAAAGTIHRRIYRMDPGGEGFAGMSVVANRDAHALFIVDEASMIGGGEGGFGDRDLLGDLFTHVFSAPGTKLLLIGDPAQLPPVGSPHSPALDPAHLHDRFGLTAGAVELTDVVRQAGASGILINATALRDEVVAQAPAPRFILGHPDVVRITGMELQDELEACYARYGGEEVCLITRSNKRAYQYSQQVRARILGFEEELSPGDRLMVVKNDYFWAGRNGKAELIANGEPMEVLRRRDEEERHGHRFCWIEAAWWSGEERRVGDFLVMLDVLALDAPSLPMARRRMLNENVLAAHAVTGKGARLSILRQDPYANALQVKYAYAVTAHKAQGGQWPAVFVDQGYITEEMIDTEYVRWLYTAITRASDRLYLLNFHPRFFGEED
ncbi:MAG: AAA family ATPase [Flavobacteriales bacterium]|nr:AAA family ATPase [Flavobacteriales bacterium]